MSRRAARTAPDLASAFAVADDEMAVLTTWTPHATEIVSRVRVDAIAPSPFQPRGRPSEGAVADVRGAIGAAGDVATLMEPSSETIVRTLGAEARALAELAADVAAHGVETPLEARRTAKGLELLSGHRRLAAARLAGVGEVPVVDRGEMADHDAASVVYRRNLLRKDFTAWQEALSFAAIQRNRRDAGLPDSVRVVARALGASHGRAGDLLTIARSFSPAVIGALSDDAEAAEDALAALSFRTLRELACLRDEHERIARTREAAGLTAPSPTAAARLVGERVDRRGGGFTLNVRKAAERMTASEAEAVLAVLDAETARLRTRLAVLGALRVR
ncbi:MAG: ParB N-terminal domain-containing protein [Gemmatirosa sp.]|nr:ParB N-terminal domain-containing protein [Gemmatirosa sp.]